MIDSPARRIWEAALGQLQLQVTRPSYDTWLRETVGLSLQADRLVIGTPSTFAAEWLEQRMYQLIRKTVQDIARQPVEVQFQVCQNSSNDRRWDGPWRGATETLPATPLHQRPPGPFAEGASPFVQTLNPRYTFDSFVIGKSNQLAHAAAQAVSGSPGHAYNPLFIYSDVGLGKTHLLHAVAHQVAQQGLDFLYVSSEQFTNDFIAAIRERTTAEFRAKYRSVDVLLIDDIQFISGKEQTQEGFFHTFNDLHNANRQILLTSDRPPKALALLEDRLRSRFEWGLIADIQPPDLETRLAILRFKAEQSRVPIDNAVFDYIAHKAQKNIRELEGCLNRIIAFAQLTQSPITVDLAARTLADISPERYQHPISPQLLLQQVSAYYRIPLEVLTGKRRDKRTATARQIAMYLLREEGHRPLQEIGHLLGGRNHATVLHGVKKIAQDIEADNDLRHDVFNLRERLIHPDPQFAKPAAS